MTSNQILTVITHQNSFLSVRVNDGFIVHSTPDHLGADFAPAYLYRPEARNDVGFLIPGVTNLDTLTILHYIWRGRIKSLRVRSRRDISTINLTDPLTGMFLSALPFETLSGVGLVEANRSVASTWESFSLHPAQEVPDHVFNIARLIQRFVTDGLGLNAILKMLRSDEVDFDTTQACARFIMPEQLDVLATTVIRDDGLFDNLVRISNKDIWADCALPALRRWLSTSRLPSEFPQTAGVELDELERVGIDGRMVSLSMAIDVSIRRAVAPRKRACVLATARNEGLYLIDWLAHHRSVGFEDFFIYTNNNDDGSDDLLNALSDAGVIRLIRNVVAGTVGPQYKAYGHALQILPDILDYEWVMVIDLDEYVELNSHKFTNISEYIAWQECVPVDSIALNWVIRGPNGQLTWRDAPLRERFSRRENRTNPHVKSLSRPQRFIHSQCHFPFDLSESPRIYKDPSGSISRPSPFNNNSDCDYAWIDHYYYKSLEEFLVRRMRSKGDSPVSSAFDEQAIHTKLVELYLAHLDASLDQESYTDLARSGTEQEREMLIALPGVKSALSICKAAFQADVAMVKVTLGNTERFHIPGSPEARLYGLLSGQADSS